MQWHLWINSSVNYKIRDNYYLLISLGIFFIVIILINGYLLINTFASPSLSRQEITDENTDWYITPGSSKTLCEAYTIFPDLESVSYFSNGKFLNITMWLNDLIDESIINYKNYLTFNVGIILDPDSKLKTDYLIKLSLDTNSSKWIKTFYEISSNDIRILDSKPMEDKYEGIENTNRILGIGGKSHVNILLDLNKINLPEQYIILFYINNYIVSNSYCVQTDISDYLAYVPPPIFSISTLSEPPIMLRPGNAQMITLIVNSTIKTNSNITYFSNENEILHLEFLPKVQSLVQDDLTKSLVKIKFLENASKDLLDQLDKQGSMDYPISILTNITFPKIDALYFDPLGAQKEIIQKYNINKSQIITNKPHYLTILLQPRLNILDYLKSLEEWITPINAIYTLLTGIGTIIIPLIIRSFLKKKRNKKVR
jgi:hypothetical protein